MGHYVHISVVFACDENEGVAELAKKHLPYIENRDAIWFLEDLAKRTGTNPGPKGGLSMWGMIGNYTSGAEFCDCLRPFWMDLLSEIPGGPHNFEHVIVFQEVEQSESAKAFEIYLESEENPESLVIKEHECPFAWMQF